jgi:hypothetical protein
MSLENAIQLFAIINFLIIGVSHVTAPRAWADFFLILRAKGEAGVFAVAYMSLIFGSIVAAFHNVWSGIPVVLTVIGWGQVLKAFLYFAFPRFGLRRLEMVSHERAYVFRYPGVVLIILAGALIYHLAVG